MEIHFYIKKNIQNRVDPMDFQIWRHMPSLCGLLRTAENKQVTEKNRYLRTHLTCLLLRTLDK